MFRVKTMNEKQLKEALVLTPADRYDYFVQCCAQYEQVWGIAIDGSDWLIFNDADGDEIFPVWPTEQHAQMCCFEEHQAQNAVPKAITLASFIERCIPDMYEEDILFGVFYDQNGEGLSIEVDMLHEAFVKELRV